MNGMMGPNHDLNTPRCGVINQPDFLLPWPDLDAGLEARKGRLYWLCEPGVDQAWIAEIQQRYYADPSYDTLPSLSAALTAIYDQFPDAQRTIHAVAALQGLEAFIVGAQECSVWLARPNEARIVLPPKTSLNLHAGETHSAAQGTLHLVQARLFTGDALVMIATRAGLTPDGLAKAARANASADSIARAVARQASKATRRPIPVTVIQLPGFMPIPDLGPSRGAFQPRRPSRAPSRPPGEGSPIWPALIVAFAAIAISLWFRRPQLSHENIQKMAMAFLTPPPSGTVLPAETATVVTATSQPTLVTLSPSAQHTAVPATLRPSPRPTTTPTPSTIPSVENYAIPELLSPQEGEDVRADGAALRWSWLGSLAQDEYFDVRLWRIGTDAKGIAWTKEPEYVARHLDPGWYFWTVAVVRGHNGVIERELCQEAPAMSFYYVGNTSGRSTTESSTSAPTRVSPDDRPTRVSPDLDNRWQAPYSQPIAPSGDKE